MVGQVLNGINNIYTVDINGALKQCRIKGKVLKLDETSYNPIAVGDYVKVEEDPHSVDMGQITERVDRRTTLVRWNKKRRAPQVIAANVDIVVCVMSVKSPPFRPRFVDRLLVTCGLEEIEPLILVNKTDLKFKKDAEARIRNYRDIGYKVIMCSAKTGVGIDELKEEIAGKLTVFTGQSGVGKSSVLNMIQPGLNLKVGSVSVKHNRGSHTTCFSSLITLDNGLRLIDTPGIRELFIYDIDPGQLRFYFMEFLKYADTCEYPSSCLHLDEPSCSVRDAVDRGEIHRDRYESYVRIYQNLEDVQKGIHE